MLKNLERKNNLGGYQKEKLYTLKMKNANKKMFVNNDLNQFMKDALDKKSRFEDDFGKSEKEENVTDVNERQMIQSRKAYYRELKKVIEASDVLIEVLDARDPEGCRSQEIEQEALKQNKKVLLILNKIDLVPPQNARMWQKYLRSEFPTLLFKANQ